jgi:hypothetical protein
MRASFLTKSVLFFFMVMLLTSCSTVRTYPGKPIDTSRKPAVVVRIKNDTERLFENIARRIEELGFKVIQNGGEADYYADVAYTTYFDVVHQTFNQFDIVFVDGKTEETVLRSRYLGRVGFNGCQAALDLVFKDLSRNVRRETRGTTATFTARIPDEAAAVLYVIRPGGPVGSKPGILINGIEVAKLADLTYFSIGLKPGAYTVKVDWSRWSGVADRQVTFHTEASKAYYLLVETTMSPAGFYGTGTGVAMKFRYDCSLAFVDAARARMDITQNGLTQTKAVATDRIVPK